jgi:AraC-like DNA-binding protein
MSTVICAEDQPAPARLEYFRHALRDTIVPFDLGIDAGTDLRARLVTGTVGTLQVTTVTGPPRVKAIRTSRLIRRSDPELLKIDVLTRGRGVLEQEDRQAALRPGDLTLVDLSRPCRLACSEENEMIAVRFPRTLLPLRHEELTRLTAVRIAGQQGLGGMLSSLAIHMSRHLDDYDAGERTRLSAALLDLLTVGLSRRLDRGGVVAPDSQRRVLLLRIRAFIEQRLGDPELSPSTIAAAHFISLRYLHKLFEAEGTTVAGWVRTRRLERCRRDLLDPVLAARPARAIAARWGLIDATHFGRLFRSAYGLPPAEYRQRHLGLAVTRPDAR